MAKSKKQLHEEIRQRFMAKVVGWLTENEEEVLTTKSNEIAIPCLDEDGNDEWCVITFKVPTGSRDDGEAYDGYGMATQYAEAVAEKEAKAKAEAENAEIDAAKELQGMYQTMLTDANTWLKDAHDKVEGLRAERDHYKQDRDELREKMEKLQRSVIEWKRSAEEDRSDMKMQIAKLGRKVELMAPFMCGDLTCKLRQRVIISDDGVVKTAKSKKTADIEPIEQEAL